MTRNSFQIKQLRQTIVDSMSDQHMRSIWTVLDELVRKYKFEMKGRSNVFAIAPNFISKSNFDAVATATAHVHGALQKMLLAFKAEGAAGPLHDYFRPYERFYPLIQEEVRKLDDIMLMRADYSAVMEETKRKAFEPNTACPGLSIDYPVLNNAMEEFLVEQGWLNPGDIYKPPMFQETAFFGRKLVQLAKRVLPHRPPNVLLGNYHGVYTSELEGLLLLFSELSAKDQDGGKILYGDVAELEERGEYFYFRGEPISLIFNKLDPLIISQDKNDLSTWFKAATSPNIEFLNSCGAMFLAETKRSFGAITDPEIQKILGFDDGLVESLKQSIPETIPLHRASSAKIDEILSHKNSWVLKPDALTRGDGVKLGREQTSEEWSIILKNAPADEFVLQRDADTEKMKTVVYDTNSDTFNGIECFHGMDVFVIDGEVVGYSSRCRDHRVINVGAGGYEAPLIVIK